MTGGYVHQTRDERLRDLNFGCLLIPYLCLAAGALLITVLIFRSLSMTTIALVYATIVGLLIAAVGMDSARKDWKAHRRNDARWMIGVVTFIAVSPVLCVLALLFR